jgi:hypothetical protein
MTPSLHSRNIVWESDWMSSLNEDFESKLCVGFFASGHFAGVQIRRDGGAIELSWAKAPSKSEDAARSEAYQHLEKSAQFSHALPHSSPQFTQRNDMTSNISTVARRVAILSGEDTNVGKSTLARHMLRPGLIAVHGSCQYLLVEKIDRDIAEGEDKRYNPEELKAISKVLAFCGAKKLGAVVVDVGGGQAPAFMSELKEAQGSEARIDLFVLPVVATQKVDKIVETIEELLLLGVPAEKLNVVINRAPIGKSVSDLVADGTFAVLDNHATAMGYRIVSVALPVNEAVERLRDRVTLTVDALAGGTADFNAEFERLVAAGQDEEADAVFELEYMGGVAKSMKMRMDACFAEIFGLTTAAGIEVVEVDG